MQHITSVPVSILRIREVCRVTGLARSTVYALAARGEFPPAILLTKSGRAVGWRSDDLDRWLETRTQESRAVAA